MEQTFEKELQSKNILIIGGGVTGEALASYFLSQGVTPSIFDEKVESVLGIRTISTIDQEYDLVVVSPGWKLSHPVFLVLKDTKAEVFSEIDFAWKIKCERWPEQKWLAITGTNGKTTTTQMLESIFNHTTSIMGAVCGNVGRTAIEVVTGEIPYDYLALELSSFQIQWSLNARFKTSAILNIAEDHVDWHGSFSEYAQTKFRLLALSDLAILNGDDPEVVLRAPAVIGPKVMYSLEAPAPGEIGLVENLLVDRAFVSDPNHAESFAELMDIKPTVPHNVSNAMAAAALALSIGISHEEVRSGLSSFVLDHHRMELVLDKAGVKWINDSKATNPHAASASLMSHHNVIWIAGGLAKGAQMAPLIRRAGERIKHAIVIGTDAQLIEESLRTFAPHVGITHIYKAGTAEDFMDSIVLSAYDHASPGDVVLLAPACASMDQFISYAQRGSLFVDAVQRLVASE